VQDPFEVAEMRVLVDHEAFDLVELRRVGRIRIDAIGAPGQTMRIGGLSVSMVRTCTGEVWVRTACASRLLLD